MKRSKRFGIILMVLSLVLAFYPHNVLANAQSQPPNITSTIITNRTIAYMGNTTPGFTSISIKTDKPSRGYIDVIGNGQSTRINLSSVEFKSEHTVNWAPWNEGTRNTLPPGVYTLRLNLWDSDYNASQGYPLGTVTVVGETNPKQLFSNVSATPSVIKPIFSENKDLTNIQFSLSRHAEVQLTVMQNKEYFKSSKFELAPGTHSFTWNGRDEFGNIVPDGEYEFLLNALELNYNNPKTRSNTVLHKGTISVRNGEYGLPAFRFDEIIQSVSLNDNSMSLAKPRGERAITGSIAISENATAEVWIVNAAGVHVNNVMSQQQVSPGVYSFSWDGTDFFGGTALNGTYHVKVGVADMNRNWAHRLYNNLSINLVDGYSYPISEQAQRVKVIVPETQMAVWPMNQGYIARQGEIFTLIEEDTFLTPPDKYFVLIAGQVPGYVNKHDVEIIVETTPIETPVTPPVDTPVAPPVTPVTPPVEVPVETPGNVIHTVVRGDTLWKISLQYGTTVAELVNLNNLNVNDPIEIGQRILISSKPSDIKNPSNIYVVKAGDSLWKIAQAHNTTVNELVNLNKIDPAVHLYIGQNLLLPGAPVSIPPVSTPPQVVTYTVKAGDSLWKIAQAHNTTVNELVNLNKIDPAVHLYIGQSLLLPGAPISTPPVSTPPQVVTYTVKSGDSLWKIAQSYKTTVDKIAALNNLNPNQPIQIGQQIRIQL